MIPAIPFGWTWIPAFGIQKTSEGAVPSNVYLKEDELLAGDQLNLYIQTQIALMKRTFLNPTIAGPAPLHHRETAGGRHGGKFSTIPQAKMNVC